MLGYIPKRPYRVVHLRRFAPARSSGAGFATNRSWRGPAPCEPAPPSSAKVAGKAAQSMGGGASVIQAIALVLDFAPVHWSSSTRMVAIALADYANTDTGHCWPSIANLSRRTGLSNRQVQRCLREIEADGWIERTAVHKVGTNLWIWRKRIALGGDTSVTPPLTWVSPPLRGKG